MDTTTLTAANTTAPMFKSLRAAKIAMTKATRAYEEVRHAWAVAMNGSDLSVEAPSTIAAWEHMEAVYNAATAQGFFVRCYHVEPNATRDLIRANMD